MVTPHSQLKYPQSGAFLGERRHMKGSLPNLCLILLWGQRSNRGPFCCPLQGQDVEAESHAALLQG